MTETQELIARLRELGNLIYEPGIFTDQSVCNEAASALEHLVAERDARKAEADDLWNRPDMHDPAPEQNIHDYLMTVPYRGEWVVPGVLIRLVKRAKAEAVAAEREACAADVDEFAAIYSEQPTGEINPRISKALRLAAKSIRARNAGSGE